MGSERKPSSRFLNRDIISSAIIIVILLIVLNYVVNVETDLGLFLLEQGAFNKNNVFFDADPFTSYIHSDRSKIVYIPNLRHPLIIPILSAVLKISEYLTIYPLDQRFILTNVLVGGFSVVQFYVFLSLVIKDRLFSLMVALIFTFNFSTVIFSIIPDTWIYAQMSIGAMFMVFYFAYYDRRLTGKLRLGLIVLVGVFVTGITITNAVFFFIALIVFEAREEDQPLKKAAFKAIYM